MSRLFTAVIGAVALLLGTGPTVQAQDRGRDHADSVHFRNLCRQSAQIVRTGSPRDRVSRALDQLKACGAEERQVLIQYWLDGMYDGSASDENRLERTSALLGVQDRRLFDGALRLAQDQSLSLEQRTIAMVVLVAQLEPRMIFEVDRLRAASPTHYCGGPEPVDHLEAVVGEALPADAYAQAKAAMDAIVGAAGRTSAIGAAAACVRLTLVAYSQPVGP